MSKHSKKELTATNLRLLLTCAIIIVIMIAVGGFYFINKTLGAFAADVAQVSTEAEASNTNIQRLQRVEQELARNEEAVERAAGIVAESTSYQYQNQIVNDLNNYAERAGIELTGFTFANSTPGTATPAPAAGATAVPTTPVPAGVNSTTVTVQTQPTLPYRNFLQFVRSIEQNLTKMQISNLTLAKASEGGNDTVAGQALIIEVYIR